MLKLNYVFKLKIFESISIPELIEKYTFDNACFKTL